MKKLWLDMDGVIVDFTGGLCEALDIPFSYIPYTLPQGLWDYIQWLWCKHNVSWSRIQTVCSDPRFWKNLSALPSAMIFYEKLICRFDVKFLTTPTGEYGANFVGKRKWLEQYNFATPYDKRMILLNSDETKEDYASPGYFLIDDQDKNVQAFRHGGGYAVLVPRPWNNRHREFISFEYANNLVLNELKEI